MQFVKPPLLAVLVPVRDCAGELDGFLDALEPLADAVIALDDGSQDDTWQRLAADPRVTIALRNPPRGDWNDHANRQALLDASSAVKPRWVLYLDLDERIPADDAQALKAFLETDALPGCAYGLQHYRAWGAEYDPEFTWIYRLFSWAPGLELPAVRLHFNPIPLSIPIERWVRTTIRVQHLGAASPELIATRRQKYADADRGGEQQRRLEAPPQTKLQEWQPRRADLPVLAALEPESEAPPHTTPRPSSARLERPELAVLVPARDAATDLPGFLESAARLTDTVVALDDGSTDATTHLLADSPLTRALIKTGRKTGLWDDAANRQALLGVTSAIGPRWILFLDIDERISSDDASALKRFLKTDAVPGFAYGFRVLRMIGDLDHFDRDDLVVYRLFAFKPGQQLPPGRLHLVPVPESIPRERWLETTLRIQHLASLTAHRRQTRHAKYVIEDPLHEFQSSYERLLDEPGTLRRFEPRAAGASLFATQRESAHELEEGPALSVIVIAREDADRIAPALDAILAQDCPEPFEVIVVVSGSERTARVVRERFGNKVKLVELKQPVLPGAARNAGLERAKGEFVSFPGSHVQIAPGTLAARLVAHREGAAMVTGTITNGTDTPAGWASYFIDHADALPGKPSGELSGPPLHCSYMRHHLEQIGGFPEHLRAGEDTVVNHELFARGYRARRVQEIVLVHRSRCDTVPRLLRHHFQRGRALGNILRSNGVPFRRRLEHARRYVPDRVRYIEGGVGLWGGDELEQRYREVRSLVRAGVLAAWSGYVYEVLSSVRR